jgi:glycosyltransferase involved in cell wall biosynthesis
MTSAPPLPAVPRLSVVVPIFQASGTIGACIAALVAAASADDELIVADDGSTDGGCAELDGRVRARLIEIRSDSNIGRGPIRNLGAARATGDVIVFVDADVVIHVNALDAIRDAFSDRNRECIIGSYDDQPSDRGVVSQYRNLLHHVTHHTQGATATHFWTGLGAVRRDVFEALGGLDEVTWARNMEDVEFGHRLVDAGITIDVLPNIQGTHLKGFTLRSMVRTDLVNRAVPWSRLMLHDRLRRDAFVMSRSQRVSAMGVAATLIGVVGGRSRHARRGGFVGAGVFIWSNVGLWQFFRRQRGLAFALKCVPLHALHSAVSILGFSWAVTEHVARACRRPFPIPRSRKLRPAPVEGDRPPR